MPPLFDLRNVTVFVGDRIGLRGLTLRIEVGEHVCVLGPNGSGKSTLIRTITRDLYPVYDEASSMAILGKERWDLFELRGLLGIVSPGLLATCTTDATGRDVVLSGFFGSTRIFARHRPGADLVARAGEALARLGLSHLADRPVAEMSSGEAKRTLVARALVHGPRTLVFDEPGNTLDIGGQYVLRETMRDLARSGIGIVLVTHHVSEIIPEIGRVVLLREGRVADDGPKERILTEEKLRSLFGVPVRLTRDGENFHAH